MGYENTLTEKWQEGYEIERKFLIEYPDIDWLERACCEKIAIDQTYLLSDEKGISSRIRRWETGGRVSYIQNTKKPVSDLRRIEAERLLTCDEYEKLLCRADPQRITLKKTRYRVMSGGKCVEIDVFPFWCDKALAEVELESEDEAFTLPENIRVIREVTHEDGYKNTFIALKSARSGDNNA